MESLAAAHSVALTAHTAAQQTAGGGPIAPEPTDARSGSARARLVDAAISLVAGPPPSAAIVGRATRANAFGAEAVGIRAVAEAAGLTHAAPLHHFPDRVSLLAAVSAEGNRRLATALETAYEAEKDRGTRSALGAVVRAQAMWAAHNPGLWDVMVNPQLTADTAAVWRGRQTDTPAAQMLAPGNESAASPAAARALARRAETFDELVDAKLQVLDAYVEAVHVVQPHELNSSLVSSADRRPLVGALTTIADGLSMQFVAERGTSDEVLASHVDRTLDLLLSGVLRS